KVGRFPARVCQPLFREIDSHAGRPLDRHNRHFRVKPEYKLSLLAKIGTVCARAGTVPDLLQAGISIFRKMQQNLWMVFSVCRNKWANSSFWRSPVLPHESWDRRSRSAV